MKLTIPGTVFAKRASVHCLHPRAWYVSSGHRSRNSAANTNTGTQVSHFYDSFSLERQRTSSPPPVHRAQYLQCTYARKSTFSAVTHFMANTARVSVGRRGMRQALTELILCYKRINRFGRSLTNDNHVKTGRYDGKKAVEVRVARQSKQASIRPGLPEHSASLPAVVVSRLLRIQDAAKYLSATIWRVETLIREKTIPSFVLGEARVVDRLELDRLVERRNAEAKAAAENAPRKPERVDKGA
jgi:hypothetical protein